MPSNKISKNTITDSQRTKQANPLDSCIEVRHSGIHGQGVFAKKTIYAGDFIIEYKGEIITNEQADIRHSQNAQDPYHTFYFQLESTKVIDGGVKGNESRWINHSCTPNTEAYEDDNEHVFIYATKDILAGDEITYNYRLVLDESYTDEIKACYACFCGTNNCQGTMLGLEENE